MEEKQKNYSKIRIDYYENDKNLFKKSGKNKTKKEVLKREYGEMIENLNKQYLKHGIEIYESDGTVSMENDWEEEDGDCISTDFFIEPKCILKYIDMNGKTSKKKYLLLIHFISSGKCGYLILEEFKYIESELKKNLPKKLWNSKDEIIKLMCKAAKKILKNFKKDDCVDIYLGNGWFNLSDSMILSILLDTFFSNNLWFLRWYIMGWSVAKSHYIPTRRFAPIITLF